VFPEETHRLGPKGTGSGMSAPNSLIADDVPPAERRNLTDAGTGTKRDKPVGLPPVGLALPISEVTWSGVKNN